MYDLVIIGSGPAGLTAAIYAQRACLNTIVVEKMGISGGQILSTYEVDNYPGLNGIIGFELGDKMKEHADALGCQFTDDEIIKIESREDYYTITGEKNSYQTKGIVIASGTKHRHLEVPGEEDYTGIGVSYCATCDGAFYKGRDVCVVGGGEVACEDAVYLSGMCNKVFLIHRRDELRASKAIEKKVTAIPNIIPLWNCQVQSINGENCVENVTIVNKKENIKHRLKVSGVFIAVGVKPESGYFMETVNTDSEGYIIAGEDTRTNMPRIYAIGDVRTKKLRQIITACADGANAVESYLEDIM